MTNVIGIESAQKMRPSEVIRTLVEAGFTSQQAMGLTSVILGIRSGVISIDDAEHFLEQAGFEDQTAENLTKVFFQALAAA